MKLPKAFVWRQAFDSLSSSVATYPDFVFTMVRQEAQTNFYINFVSLDQMSTVMKI